jgi:hypothetical protein
MKYRPAKPQAHRHGKPTGNAQRGAVEVVNFGDAPIGAKTISRGDVSAYRGHSAHRRQTAEVDAARSK